MLFRSLCFEGDVARCRVRAGLVESGLPAGRGVAELREVEAYDLDELDEAEVALIVAAWEVSREAECAERMAGMQT